MEFLVVGLFVGFVGGYGLRHYISRRRHAAAILKRLHEQDIDEAPPQRPPGSRQVDPVLLAKLGVDLGEESAAPAGRIRPRVSLLKNHKRRM
jgi:hypothetical protein